MPFSFLALLLTKTRWPYRIKRPPGRVFVGRSYVSGKFESTVQKFTRYVYCTPCSPLRLNQGLSVRHLHLIDHPVVRNAPLHVARSKGIPLKRQLISVRSRPLRITLFCIQRRKLSPSHGQRIAITPHSPNLRVACSSWRPTVAANTLRVGNRCV